MSYCTCQPHAQNIRHLQNNLLLLPSWGQQPLNTATLKSTCSCSCHPQAPKFLLILSWVPQAPAHAILKLTSSCPCTYEDKGPSHTILRPTNSCFYNPELSKLLILPSWSPQAPAPTMFRPPNFYSRYPESHKLQLTPSWGTQTCAFAILRSTRFCSYHLPAQKFLHSLSRDTSGTAPTKVLLLPFWDP